MRIFGILTLFLFIEMCALADEGASSPSDSQGEFHLDRGVVEELYRQTLEETVDTTMISGSVVVSPQLSYFMLSEFTLNNNYHEVPYTESLQTLPLLLINVATPILRFTRFDLLGQARVGYTYKVGVIQVRPKSGSKLTSDNLKLHWIPLSLSSKLAYHIPGVNFIIPSIAAGAGAQWFYQSGKLDGIEQGFWVPFYHVSAGLTFFDHSHRPNHWFGGVSIGASYQDSFASDQAFRGSSVDLDVSFLL